MLKRSVLRSGHAFFALGFTVLAVAATSLQAEPSPANTAAEVDRLILNHLESAGVKPAGLVNDEDFLRRVTLDLTGTIPTPRETTLFGLDVSPTKRSAVVNRLMESEAFGESWSRYWSDVIFLRATDQRSRIGKPAFQSWMAEQLNQNRPWDEIVTALITAKGNVTEAGETGLIFAHSGEPEEVAAEISRIFMGIQLSCANCHDHPMDQWTREQFHQLAAFLPRVTVRPESPGDIRTFTVRSIEELGRGAGRDANINFAQLVRVLDRNRDGKIARTEARGILARRFDETLKYADRDKDGMFTAEELKDVQLQANNQPGRGNFEYYMPNLDDPSSRGELMQPAFFIEEMSQPRLPRNASDDQRRSALAALITSPENRWFSRAFVNRVWTELLGEGFTTPVDDMGPERLVSYGDVLDYLSEEFVASGYDVKWLYQTILETEAYQRQLSSADTQHDDILFDSVPATRLRADQIYNSVTQIFGVPRAMRRAARAGDGMQMPFAQDRQREQFAGLFGFDPSTPRDEVLGDVPQALFMMNSPQLERGIRSRGFTQLARLLRESENDEVVLEELYLLILCRTPRDSECEIHEAYLEQVGNRDEAFEDIMWSLLNSTEFLSRR